MLNSHTHSKWFRLYTHTARIKHLIYIASRMARSQHHSTRLYAISTRLHARHATILDEQSLNALRKVNLATALDNLSAYIGNNSRQTIGADMRMRLVENLLRRTMKNQTLQGTIIIATFFATREEFTIRERSCTTLAKGVIRIGIYTPSSLNLSDILAALDNILTSFEKHRSQTVFD